MAEIGPLIILAPPRSFTTVICAVLGQHPQMYALPETHLFTCSTIGQWWTLYRGTDRTQGLARGVAEIIFGGQTPAAIQQARQWLLQRCQLPTTEVLRSIMQRVEPRILVEKTPQATAEIAHMQRMSRAFPDARFLHLLRHPFGQVRSRLERRLSASELGEPEALLKAAHRLGGDPQLLWYRCHRNILAFLKTIPPGSHLQIRGEDILSEPDHHLPRIARWLELRSGPVEIEQMKHPERSPFADFGPANARRGGDEKFFQHPALRPVSRASQSLNAPLPWRADGAGFLPELRELARQFGYAEETASP
jgi:hypothetical protein